METQIGNLVSLLASGTKSDAITARLAELEERRAQLQTSLRVLEEAARTVGLSDAQIAEASEKLAAASPDTPAGLRTLLATVLRVNVFADHIEVYTLFGGGSPTELSPDIKTAAREFINTVGVAPASQQGFARFPAAFAIGGHHQQRDQNGDQAAGQPHEFQKSTQPQEGHEQRGRGGHQPAGGPAPVQLLGHDIGQLPARWTSRW